MLVQVQDIVRFIEYIQWSKTCMNQFRNAFNANVSYPIDIETVYLPSQRSNLFEQKNAAIGIIKSPCWTFIGSVHISRVIQFCPIRAISVNKMIFLIPSIGYFCWCIWQKASAKSEMSRSFNWKNATCDSRLQNLDKLAFYERNLPQHGRQILKAFHD